MLYQLLVVNQQKYQHSSSDGEDDNTNSTSNAEWSQTAVIIVDGISSTTSNNLNIMKRDPTFPKTWHELLQYLGLFLDRKVLELSKAVFAGQSSTLEEIEDADAVSKDAVDEAWALWKNNNPASHNSLTRGSPNNQDALLLYLRHLSQILRLKDIEPRARLADDVMAELQICVTNAKLPAYSIDIERTSAVQQGVLENIKMIPITSPAGLFLTVRFLAFLINLPYRKTIVNRQEQTYLAMSKAAIELLQTLAIKHAMQSAASYELITQALGALAEPIQMKYQWYAAGEAPSMWRKATTTILEILEKCMANVLKTESSSETTEAFWTQVFRVIDAVVTADCDTCADETNIPADQDFDIDAFHRLQQLVVPALGSTHTSQSTCTEYAKIVFEKSLIHKPHPDDLAREDQELLDGLTNHRIGLTYNVPATPRAKMSYVLLDELFSLVTIHDGTPERIRLARAAAPYLILRTGLVLKAYVLDHPLRGRAPQPGSQKVCLALVLPSTKMTNRYCKTEGDALCVEEAGGLGLRTESNATRTYCEIKEQRTPVQTLSPCHQSFASRIQRRGDDGGVRESAGCCGGGLRILSSGTWEHWVDTVLRMCIDLCQPTFPTAALKGMICSSNARYLLSC